MKIVTYPDPVLRQKTEPVESVDDEVLTLIEAMTETMYHDDGVGLAAPQVGISKRIIVMDAGEGWLSLINPEIVELGTETDRLEEGCLSFPGIRIDITRPTRVTVRGLNEKGTPVEIKAEGLLARVLQHEIDHLNGILIIDHAAPLSRRLMSAKLKKHVKVSE